MFGSSLLVFPKSACRMKGNTWSVCCLLSSALWTPPRAPLRTNNPDCMEKGPHVGSIESARVPQLNAAPYKNIATLFGLSLVRWSCGNFFLMRLLQGSLYRRGQAGVGAARIPPASCQGIGYERRWLLGEVFQGLFYIV